MKFTDSELDTISHALSVAASIYDGYMARLSHNKKLADQFQRQAAEVRAIAERIYTRD